MPVIGYLCPSWKKNFKTFFENLKSKPWIASCLAGLPSRKGHLQRGLHFRGSLQCLPLCMKRSTKHTPWCCQSRGGTQRESAWPFTGVYPQADPLLSRLDARPAVGVLSPLFSAVVQSRLLLAQMWENHLRRQHPEMRSITQMLSSSWGSRGPGARIQK